MQIKFLKQPVFENRVYRPAVNLWKRFLILLFGCVLGCAAPQVKSSSAPQITSERYCLLFVVDALSGPFAQRWMREGKLPNFKKHLYDRGLWVSEATSVFPSVTAAAMTSLMTGVYPGKHDIVNFQWINREQGYYKCYIGSDIFGFAKDLNPQVKTLFHYFPKDQTASFGFLVSHGSGHSDSLIYTALNPLRGLAPKTHVAFSELMSSLRLGNGFPRLMAVYEWNVDERSHRNDIDGAVVLKTLQKADAYFGDLVCLYEERGIYEQTYFVLVSDHGIAPVKKTLYVDRFLQEQGFQTRRISWNLGESHIPSDWDRVDSLLLTIKKIYGKDAIVGASGGGCATIDLVKRNGTEKKEADYWKQELTYSDVRHYRLLNGKTVDLIELLSSAEGVDFILVRDDLDGVEGQRKVRVINRRGELLISRIEIPNEGYFYKYEVLQGKDPLSLEDEHQVRPFVKTGRFYEGRLWYEKLKGEDYPDAVVQLCQIFDSPRASTLLLSAAKNWGFNSIIKGKHAGLLEEEMGATFCLAGPGIPHDKVAQARIVDVVPTILKLMGASYDPTRLDGQPLPVLFQE